jgi:hypothetical protein
VKYYTDAKVNGRKCTVMEVIHPVRRAYFTYHIARIFIDDELQVPIRYAAYDFPATAGGAPRVIEEYTYLNIKLNVGLTDKDFDPQNKKYNYPRLPKFKFPKLF